MDDVKLRNLSIACSLVGIVLLFYASVFIGTQAMKIEEITLENTGTITSVCGEVTNHRTSKKHVFLDISDNTGKIKTVAFNQTSLSLKEKGTDLFSLKPGREVCVIGQVSEYPKGSGQLEIIINSVEIL